MQDLFETLDYRAWLAGFFAERKAENPRVSYRSWGLRLQIDASLLMRVMQGKSHFSTEQASRIGVLLSDPRQVEYFCALVAFAKAKTANETRQWSQVLLELRQLGRKGLEVDQVAFLEGFWAVPLLSLVDLIQAPGDLPSLALALAPRLIPPQNPQSVQEELERLVRLGLLTCENGVWQRSSKHLQLSPALAEAQKQAVRSYHLRVLEHAQWAIEGLDAGQRDLSALTVS
jgi:uncharacterized protein (TIGR02147 family)